MQQDKRDIFRDRSRAESFGSRAELYDRARPSYPSELISWLSKPGAGTAIDVGCGTGQVARLLVAAGWQVTGIEIDPHMAAVAQSHGIDVVVSAFEHWQSARTVDLVCSGQAWHWIDPNHGYSRAAELLKAGGRLALFWNSYRYEASTMAVLEAIVGRYAPQLLIDSIPFGTYNPDHATSDAAMIRRSAEWFDEPKFRTFGHARSQSVDQWLEESLTHSTVALLPEQPRNVLFGELHRALADLNGGQITVQYETRVTCATRR